jgi:hypothetical protein
MLLAEMFEIIAVSMLLYIAETFVAVRFSILESITSSEPIVKFYAERLEISTSFALIYSAQISDDTDIFEKSASLILAEIAIIFEAVKFSMLESITFSELTLKSYVDKYAISAVFALMHSIVAFDTIVIVDTSALSMFAEIALTLVAVKCSIVESIIFSVDTDRFYIIELFAERLFTVKSLCVRCVNKNLFCSISFNCIITSLDVGYKRISSKLSDTTVIKCPSEFLNSILTYSSKALMLDAIMNSREQS